MSNVSNLAEAREARRLQKPRTNDGKGFALLHRKIMDVPFYKDAEAAHLWVHLILKAKHAPEVVLTDLGEKLINRGQLLSGRKSLASETGLKPDRVQYLLRKFQKLGMVDWVSHGKFSVFTIVKYDDYQSNYVPADYQQITISSAGVPTPAEQPVPADYQKITTDKEYINNNLLPNGSKYVANNQKPAEEKKSRLSCDEVWQCLKDELPEARGWRCLTDERRNLIRTFWSKANKIARNLDGKPMDMDGFRAYLRYIAQNCRWMLEDRPDQKSGKTWRRMKFDKFLTEKLYIEVREGDRDDR
ncbi:DNA replication protein [Klebsiella pneumoniae]|uniref:DNA replication protein n=1 Tax=Klebsiella pneumoniae TaxID=573 RepID=UPI00122C2DBD|nr:DNA replication protein [Klebsiella pneumoniae]KAA1598088.1 DNA replication protein [Klebsiella pneumoniae]MCJ8574575.1 DNA replication protein [Klebsiella pneumoniae]HDK5500348.1 DNA replication protein [Klebsiella pneumoniae]